MSIQAFYPGTANVFLQMEQGVTIDTGRPDQCALQYIGRTNVGTNDLQITFSVMRIDVLYDKWPPPDAGWEQDLLVNVLLLT
jgi:hypothetical protein